MRMVLGSHSTPSATCCLSSQCSGMPICAHCRPVQLLKALAGAQLSTQAVLLRACSGAHPQSAAQLHKAALEFGDRTQKPVDQPDTTFFFVNPDGSFVRAYSGLTDVKEIAEDMAEVIQKYKRNNPTWHGPKKIAKRHA